MPADQPAVHVARDRADLAVAARLQVDFNAEYDDPAPEVGWLADRLVQLTRDGIDPERGGTSVLLVDAPGAGPGPDACGFALLRFRPSTWEDALETYLAELYVQPAHRDRGIGSTLLTAVIEHARAGGSTYLDLNTTTDDLAAVALYEKFGFDCHEGKGEGPLAVYYELEIQS